MVGPPCEPKQIRLTSRRRRLHSEASAHPLAVRSWVGLDSTCGSLDHSRHRRAAGPAETKHDVHSPIKPEQYMTY